MVCTCVKRMKIAGTPRVRSVLVFWGLPEVAASGKPRPVRELFVFPVPLESPISLVWAIGLDIHKLPDSWRSTIPTIRGGKRKRFGARQCACALEPERQSTPTRPMHAATTRAVQAHSSLASRRAPGSKPARAARSRARPPPVASPPTAASPWLARPRTIPAPTSTPPPTATRPSPLPSGWRSSRRARSGTPTSRSSWTARTPTPRRLRIASGSDSRSGRTRCLRSARGAPCPCWCGSGSSNRTTCGSGWSHTTRSRSRRSRWWTRCSRRGSCSGSSAGSTRRTCRCRATSSR